MLPRRSWSSGAPPFPDARDGSLAVRSRVVRTETHGSILVRREDERTILVRMKGFITGPLVNTYEARFRATLGEKPTPLWLFDLMDIAGFEPGAVPAGAKWWKAFKEQDGTHVAFVTHYGAARMAASALGFGVGLKLLVCASLVEAQAALALLPSPPEPVIPSAKPSSSRTEAKTPTSSRKTPRG